MTVDGELTAEAEGLFITIDAGARRASTSARVPAKRRAEVESCPTPGDPPEAPRISERSTVPSGGSCSRSADGARGSGGVGRGREVRARPPDRRDHRAARDPPRPPLLGAGLGPDSERRLGRAPARPARRRRAGSSTGTTAARSSCAPTLADTIVFVDLPRRVCLVTSDAPGALADPAGTGLPAEGRPRVPPLDLGTSRRTPGPRCCASWVATPRPPTSSSCARAPRSGRFCPACGVGPSTSPGWTTRRSIRASGRPEPGRSPSIRDDVARETDRTRARRRWTDRPGVPCRRADRARRGARDGTRATRR